MRWTEFQKLRIENHESGTPWFVHKKDEAYEFAAGLNVKVPKVYFKIGHPLLIAEALLFKAKEESPAGIFVLKPDGLHSAMGVMILQRIGDNKYYDFFKKRHLDIDEIIKEQSFFLERCQSKAQYKIIAEEYINGCGQELGSVPRDYKFYCFGGDVAFVTQIDRNESVDICWFDSDFKPLDCENKIYSDFLHIAKGIHKVPIYAAEMLEAATRLSKSLKTPFVSVDLYDSTLGPVLGELTLCPGGPYYKKLYEFTDSFDRYLGSLWKRQSPSVDKPLS